MTGRRAVAGDASAPGDFPGDPLVAALHGVVAAWRQAEAGAEAAQVRALAALHSLAREEGDAAAERARDWLAREALRDRLLATLPDGLREAIGGRDGVAFHDGLYACVLVRTILPEEEQFSRARFEDEVRALVAAWPAVDAWFCERLGQTA